MTSAAPTRPTPATGRRALPTWVRATIVLGLLYLFLVGVALIESGISALGEGFQEGLLESVSHPVAGLFAGVLATVLVQSSSVTTATIVGLVGAGTLTVGAAVPMVMGANMGTTVTNTLASLGHLRRGAEFERAFAAATVHDFFNLLAVLVFLPLELAFGVLSRPADALTDVLRPGSVTGAPTSSPIKEAVKAPTGMIEDVLGSLPTAGTVDGVLLLLLGVGLLFLALTAITSNMRLLIAGRIEMAMNRLVGRGGGLIGMLIGLVMTFAVQSSSITTSIMVPMVGAGVLTLASAYPMTLGANIGTTITALLASLAVDLRAGLVVALTHTLFNVAGVLTFYPVPALREVPLRLARALGRAAAANRSLVGLYVVGLFVVVPLVVILVLQ